MNAAERMNITNMNIRYQERFLSDLSLIDLLNVAESNKKFKRAADLIFSTKYANKTVVMNQMIGQVQKTSVRKLYVKQSTLEIDDQKTCLQFLRCFGHFISRVKLLQFVQSKQDLPFASRCFSNNLILISSYINKYCVQVVRVHIDFKYLEGGFGDDSNPLLNTVSGFTQNECSLWAKRCLVRLFGGTHHLVNVTYGKGKNTPHNQQIYSIQYRHSIGTSAHRSPAIILGARLDWFMRITHPLSSQMTQNKEDFIEFITI